MLGAVNNFTVTCAEDAAAFTESNLARFQTVVFMSTTGDVLNDSQQAAFEAYIRQGGGYVGVHAAADTEYDWPLRHARRCLVRLTSSYSAGHSKHRGSQPPATAALP